MELGEQEMYMEEDNLRFLSFQKWDEGLYDWRKGLLFFSQSNTFWNIKTAQMQW